MALPICPARWLLACVALFAAIALLLFSAQSVRAQSPIHVDDSAPDLLAAHWPFDAVGITTARTTVGSEHGTLVAPSQQASGPLPPLDSSSGVLRLTGGHVTVADSAALNAATSGAFTVAMWVFRDAADIGTASTLYDSGTQAGHWYVGFLSNSTLAFTRNGIQDLASAHVLTDSTAWHHVAFTRDALGTVRVYLDGVAAPDLAVPTISAPSGAKLIGNKQGLTSPLTGLIDDVRIYARPLALSEIQRLAQGRSCAFDGSEWAQAMRDLKCALAEATAGDQIWIGAGVYLPSVYRFSPYLLKNGVDLYGGFLGFAFGGDETSLDQRPPFNPAAPLTILSGDINRNDAPSTFGNYGDNMLTLLAAGAGVTARLDGFGVQGGNSNLTTSLAAGSGGGLRAAAGSALTLHHVVFHANRAHFDGGAIASRAPLTVTASAFFSNTAVQDHGGGMVITGTLTLSGTTFISNTAGRGGGALVTAGALTDHGSLFEQNRAQFAGALLLRSSASISNTTFLRNTSTAGNGGAVFAFANAIVQKTTFTGNRATHPGSDGGAWFQSTGLLTSLGNLWLHNSAGRLGGALSTLGNSSTFDRYMGNTAGSEGGAVVAHGSITVTHSLFSDNTSGLSGAFVSDGPPDRSRQILIRNSLFVGNRNTLFAGAADVRLFDVAAAFTNNTFADPGLAGQTSVAIFRSTIGMNNNIFASYDRSIAVGAPLTDTVLTLDFNNYFNAPLAFGILPGPNDTTEDPLFTNPAASLYLLQTLSPMVDSGSDAAANAAGLTVDLLNLNRYVDGHPGRAALVDKGAFEMPRLAPFAAISSPVTADEGSAASLDGGASTGTPPLVFSWDCTDDGSFEIVGGQAALQGCPQPDNGALSVRLQVSDSLGLTSTAVATFTVLNVAPAVTAGAGQTASVGVSRSFDIGSFSDPGVLDAPWQVQVDWGDGSTDTVFAAAQPGALQAQSHTYGAGGQFVVTVTVTDKDGGSQSATFPASVAFFEATNEVYLPNVFGE